MLVLFLKIHKKNTDQFRDLYEIDAVRRVLLWRKFLFPVALWLSSRGVFINCLYLTYCFVQRCALLMRRKCRFSHYIKLAIKNSNGLLEVCKDGFEPLQLFILIDEHCY